MAAHVDAGARSPPCWVASLVGNFVGSVALRRPSCTPAARSPDRAPTSSPAIATAKDALTGPQLFWRAVLCNALVCLALWMAARTRTDAAKLVVLWWALLAFIASGFEHSIANVTIFALAASRARSAGATLARNLLWTVPGNVVGGGLVVGLGYAWMAPGRPALTPALVTAERTEVTAPEPTLAPANA